MTYQNLTLSFQEAERGRLRLRLSGSGEATEEITLERLSRLVPEMIEQEDGAASAGDPHRDVALRRRQQQESAAEAIGELLFDTLFVGRIRELFCAQLGLVARGDHRLRLRLALDLTNPVLRSLQDLPWELLHYSAWGFLALDRRFALVRSLDVPLFVSPAPTIERMRCLVVSSGPQGLARLDLNGEVDRIEAALESQTRIRAFYLSAARVDTIRHRLLELPCQILHFAGHGYADEELGLVLEGEKGEPVYFKASRWAELVGDLDLRLVVLNACSTAVPSASAVQPFHGVAQALIRAGVPAVLAMREPILDRAGLALAKTFYGRLAAGDSLDAALVEVRMALRTQLPTLDAWAIPALFLRGEDSAILAAPSRVESARPASPAPQLVGSVKVGRVSGHDNIVVGADGSGRSASLDLVKGEIEIDELEGSNNQAIGARQNPS